MEKINIHESYDSFVGHFKIYPTKKKAQAKGYEAHHIIPRAVQKRERGEEYDDRCIRLTSLQHIFAHYLYCKEHPEDKEEHFAFTRMCQQNANKLLADEKKFLDELPQMAEMREKGVQRGENHYLYGKHPSEETRKKLSDSQKGEKNGFYGKKHTEESKQKMSESHKGLQTGEKHPMYGKHHSEETRKKLSESHKGLQTGEDNPFYGKKHTEETKQKMSEAHRNISDDTRRKMSEARKGKYNGENNPRAHRVFMRDKEGNIVQVFSTVKEATEFFDVTGSTMTRWLSGKITPKNLTYTLSYN